MKLFGNSIEVWLPFGWPTRSRSGYCLKKKSRSRCCGEATRPLKPSTTSELEGNGSGVAVTHVVNEPKDRVSWGLKASHETPSRCFLGGRLAGRR